MKHTPGAIRAAKRLVCVSHMLDDDPELDVTQEEGLQADFTCFLEIIEQEIRIGRREE